MSRKRVRWDAPSSRVTSPSVPSSAGERPGSASSRRKRTSTSATDRWVSAFCDRASRRRKSSIGSSRRTPSRERRSSARRGRCARRDRGPHGIRRQRLGGSQEGSDLQRSGKHPRERCGRGRDGIGLRGSEDVFCRKARDRARSRTSRGGRQSRPAVGGDSRGAEGGRAGTSIMMSPFGFTSMTTLLPSPSSGAF